MSVLLDRNSYSQLLIESQPKVIETEEEYERALEIAEAFIANKNRSLEQTTLLKLLVILIETYEEQNHPMPIASPHDVLLHLMEAGNLKQSDLVGILGSKGVVSEIVNAKRSISKKQAKALGDFFRVSPALFI